MSRPTVILGRDGFNTEADFDAFCTYVEAHIDDEAGFTVDVEERGKRDVQTDHIKGTEEERETVQRALYTIWDAFCADDSAWPKRESA